MHLYFLECWHADYADSVMWPPITYKFSFNEMIYNWIVRLLSRLIDCKQHYLRWISHLELSQFIEKPTLCLKDACEYLIILRIALTSRQLNTSSSMCQVYYRQKSVSHRFLRQIKHATLDLVVLSISSFKINVSQHAFVYMSLRIYLPCCH